MDLGAVANDEVLRALLSDFFFSRFDPTPWLAPGEPVLDFAEKGFPTLAMYHRGTQLDELIRGHQWLGDLAIPLKRYEAAFIFQRDPARNLMLLDSFAKLQFLKIAGSAVMQCGPTYCIYGELFKIIRAGKQAVVAENQQQDRLPPRTEADAEREVEQHSSVLDRDWEQKEKNMLQDFGESWTAFVEG